MTFMFFDPYFAKEFMFKVTFRSSQTLAINSFDTAAMLKEKLEAIDTIDSVDISMSSTATQSVCTSDGSNIVTIKFLSQTGGSPWMDQF